MIAIAILLITVVLGGDPPTADLDDAVRFYERGDYNQAASLLSRQCPGIQNCGDARLWLGKSLLKLRRWDDAIREFEMAVSNSPANSQYHLWLGRAYGAKAEHVSPFSAFSLARKVGKEFETAVRLDPANLDARFDLLEFYLDAPGIVGGGKDLAMTQVKEMGRVSPFSVYAARARAFEKDKQWQKAKQELTAATQAFPDRPEAFGDLAEYLLRRKEYNEAEAAAGQALKLRPRYRKVILLQSAARVQQEKDLPSAQTALQELAKGPLQDDDPGYQEVYYWLGSAYLAQGKKSEARQAYSTALKFDPDYEAARAALSKM